MRLGAGFLEFHWGRKVGQFAADDVRALALSSGTFKVVAAGASVLGGRRRYTFSFGRLANARLFCHYLAQLTGRTIDPAKF